MTDSVLFVDDEPNVLDGIRRQLRTRFAVHTATSPEAGLHELAEHPEIEIVVSDMRMPGMNGAAFLARVRELRPDAVRMILSGQSDVDDAISAVNNGNIFRFLTKPCLPADLTTALDDAIRQGQLLRAERELLEKTLSGAVEILVEVLALSNPRLFARSSQIQACVEAIGAVVDVRDAWELRIAAMLSQLGCMSIAHETLSRAWAGQKLAAEEESLVRNHSEAAAKLVGRIPRLEGVAQLIAAQHGGAVPLEAKREAQADILRAAISCVDLLGRGRNTEAVKALAGIAGGRAGEVVQAIASGTPDDGGIETRLISTTELEQDMVFEEDVRSRDGVLLSAKGKVVTETVIILLRSYARTKGIKEPFAVSVRSRPRSGGRKPMPRLSIPAPEPRMPRKAGAAP